jgi:hypothetical protein
MRSNKVEELRDIDRTFLVSMPITRYRERDRSSKTHVHPVQLKLDRKLLARGWV